MQIRTIRRPAPSNIIDASTGGFVVFVYGIGPETTQEELLTMFRDFGPILRTDVIKNKRTTIGKGRRSFLNIELRYTNRLISVGYGFVVFRHMNDALASIKAMHNTSYKGRFLQVRFPRLNHPRSSALDSVLFCSDHIFCSHRIRQQQHLD